MSKWGYYELCERGKKEIYKKDKTGLDGVSRNVGPLHRQMATVLTLASRDVKQYLFCPHCATPQTLYIELSMDPTATVMAIARG